MRTAVLALLLLGLAASASAQNCTKAATFIDDRGYIIAPIIVPALKTLSKNWTGIVFLPSNTAVNKLKATLLNGTGLDDFPTGYSWADVFGTKGLSDVLLYHLVPNEDLEPSKYTTTTKLGPYKTELAADKNGTFCTDADGELSISVNVTGSKNYTVYVQDAVAPPPAKVTSNQTTCEGSIQLLDRVLLPCGTSKSLTTVISDIKKAAAADTNSTTKTNTTSSPSTRDLPTASPSPKPSNTTSSAAAQSVCALLACSLALLSVFLGF